MAAQRGKKKKASAAISKPVTHARNPDLETVIAKSPDDPAGYLVYADWLQAQGDPRGELINVQYALSKGKTASLTKRERAILQANSHFIGGLIDPQLATFTWRWGFIDSVRFFNFKDWSDNKFDVLPLVRAIFGSPVGAFVRELKLGVIRWSKNATDVPNVLKAVAKHGVADKVRVLRLGDVHDIDIDLAHHPIGKLDILSKSFPNLEVLSVHGSDFTFGASLDLPKLRELYVETCGLSRKNMECITKRKWPKLETLKVWFGSDSYGSQCGVKDLAPIFDGSAIPKVTKLGLMNSEFTNAICDHLTHAKVTKQLEELDLSLGTMDETGRRSLCNSAKAFKHLKKLVVEESFLSRKDIAELRAIGCPIAANGQNEIEEDEGELVRYVSMAE